MTNRKVTVLKALDISPDDLHFQYFPGRFIREVYGNDGNMMLVKNSPHYSFLEKYVEIGDAIRSMKDTNYYKMQHMWGRGDKYITKKINKIIRLYEQIKKNGLKRKVQIVEEPLYERVFDEGYEIYDGHHRAAVCALLRYDVISCEMVTVDFIT